MRDQSDKQTGLIVTMEAFLEKFSAAVSVFCFNFPEFIKGNEE
ncbi:hypothetical protein BSG1_10638 [Bacillus sp. SG-1]|nr:hypothetical protein BSG1_10638 [Bacillus sp. SG-1]